MAYRSSGRFRQASTHLDTPPFSESHHPVSAIALALDRPDTLRAKLDALGDLLKGDELATTWAFTGTRHFIDKHPELSRHPWLIQLLTAIEERKAADTRAAVEVGQAASATAVAQ
jgi:hypothetical protein